MKRLEFPAFELLQTKHLEDLCVMITVFDRICAKTIRNLVSEINKDLTEANRIFAETAIAPDLSRIRDFKEFKLTVLNLAGTTAIVMEKRYKNLHTQIRNIIDDLGGRRHDMSSENKVKLLAAVKCCNICFGDLSTFLTQLCHRKSSVDDYLKTVDGYIATLTRKHETLSQALSCRAIKITAAQKKRLANLPWVILEAIPKLVLQGHITDNQTLETYIDVIKIQYVRG